MLLALVAVLTWLVTRDLAQMRWIALLAVAGIPAAFPARHTTAQTLGRFAEVIIVGLAASDVARVADSAEIVSGGVGASAVLPYLAVPLIVAALHSRAFEAAGLLGAATVALSVCGWMTISPEGVRQVGQLGYVAVCAQWLVLAAIGTIATGAMQRAVLARGSRNAPPYAEATRLLTQLRQVARQLPGATLDPGSIAEHLLEELRPIGRADRAAVFAASGGGRLVVLAQSGVDGSEPMRAAWETHLDADSAIADAWASQQPQISSRSQLRTAEPGAVSALVVPLIAGVRTVGLVALERDGVNAYPSSLTHRIIGVAAPTALRLEAALLFDEVRSIATNEERQRLAREIHDGVAQELVMIGYGIDNTAAVLPEEATSAAEELRVLRGEVTRVITELRLSLFELRSEVDRHGGLTAAIAEFARISGNQAGLKVHLSLDESGRLPATVESELLRIAQEAITNARKHSFASNLWVSCTVDPPFAQIEVSDDGQGLPDQRNDGRYGLAIMAERAERIRGRLEIRPREPNGTTVAVYVGGPLDRRSGRRDNL